MHTHRDVPEVSIPGGVGAAWAAVAAFASAVDSDLDRWLADNHRLGLTDFRALVLVGQSPDKELRVNDLALAVGLNPSSATRLVSRLESKGLASRDVCEDDRRGVYAVISDKGEALLREVRGPYEDRIRELLSAAPKHFPHLDPHRLAHSLAAIGALLAP